MREGRFKCTQSLSKCAGKHPKYGSLSKADIEHRVGKKSEATNLEGQKKKMG